MSNDWEFLFFVLNGFFVQYFVYLMLFVLFLLLFELFLPLFGQFFVVIVQE